MNKFVLGVFAGIALLIAMSVGGLYYLSEKSSALLEEKEAHAEKVRQDAVSQFGTTCENAGVKISAYVYNELKPGLLVLVAELQNKDDLYAPLAASLEQYAKYASYCAIEGRHLTDYSDKTTHKLIKVGTGLKHVHIFLGTSRHENCDSDCSLSMVQRAIDELSKLEQELVADGQY